MTLSKKKKDLLITPMNKLGLGGAFNNWFFCRGMTQDQVITLQEFIALNQVIKTLDAVFICYKNDEVKKMLSIGFAKKQKSWNKLELFLKENGFTEKDWIVLLPAKKTEKGRLPDFSLLPKEVLLKTPVFKVTDVKPFCRPMKKIGYFIFRDDWQGKPEQITVSDILKIKPKEIRDQKFDSGLNCFNRATTNTLCSIQKKFKEYGLSEKDGPFMKAFLEPIRTRKECVADLVQNLGFTKREAETAVRLGIKARWI